MAASDSERVMTSPGHCVMTCQRDPGGRIRISHSDRPPTTPLVFLSSNRGPCDDMLGNAARYSIGVATDAVTTNFDTTVGLGDGVILRETITEVSQDTAANQSTDTYTLTLLKGVAPSFNTSGTLTWSHTIDGNTTSGTFTFDFRYTTQQEITSGTRTVTHEFDGTKRTSFSGSIGNTATLVGGPATTSGSFTQTTISQSEVTVLTTEAAALTSVETVVPELVLATLPADLSPASIGAPSGSSALDALNQILHTEQGTIYSTVTGTLTSPTQTLTVRERTRPDTVTASWDVERELNGAPAFVRDITNMVSTVTVSGPSLNLLVDDPTLTSRAGSSNVSESVLSTNYVDMLTWAQDRLQRGANVQLRVASVTIDAMTTPTDRTADLYALTPGDRHQFTGLPSTQLGFSTWDGWLLGADELHTLTEHTFTLYFQPVLPRTAIYDTDRFMADGSLTLSSTITSGATTMSVATSDSLVKLETVTFPYTLEIDSEQVTVTGCTSATPQVVTMTRGANGTTPAAHTAGALVGVPDDALFAF